MSAAALALGALLVWRTASGEAYAGRPLLPIDGPSVFVRLHGATIRAGRRVGGLTRTDTIAFHLGVPVIMILVLAAAVLGFGLDLPPAAGQASQPLDWLLVLLTGVAVLGATMTRSRLAALVLVGTAGFTTALWLFFLGAFDVALTQLLVEVLTVVVAVLVLRRLPPYFHRVKPNRTALTAVIAIGAGLVAGVAAYTLTGRRKLSTAAEYFLENAPEDTGGGNVVNTILVDYRAL